MVYQIRKIWNYFDVVASSRALEMDMAGVDLHKTPLPHRALAYSVRREICKPRPECTGSAYWVHPE